MYIFLYKVPIDNVSIKYPMYKLKNIYNIWLQFESMKTSLYRIVWDNNM